MPNQNDEKPSRRDFLRLAGAAAAAGPFLLSSGRAGALQAGPKTLRIAKWAHFLPEYDAWFELGLAREWGEKNGVQVIVDHVPVEEIHALATAETAAGKGHDLFMFPWPPAEFQRHVIDHAGIYQSVAFRHGNVDRLGHKSTYDPKTRKYFAFADSWMPTPFQYYEDDWRAVGMPLGPVHYGSLRSGGQRIRARSGLPCGLALAPGLESNVTLYGILHAFGGAVLDAEGNAFLNRGSRTVAALKYVKALYDDAGTPDQLAWGSAGNVKAMVAHRTSCSINAISLLRTAERDNPEAAKEIRLCPPLLGSAGVMAFPHVTNCSVVWSFAENREGATRFLSDLIDSSKTVYEKSQGCNFPIYQKTLPDLIVRLENDPRGDPPYKYKELKDALHWTANLGYPGFASPAGMEAFNAFVVPRMFLRVVKGESTPEDAARTADVEVQRIVDKWRQAG